ncbi:glutamate racemase [Synechococcus sp. RedBA-s]|uniref:glutamate racemase n=1 Tax=Synechococcus sp. RedBA-s TaxID=2823741 RepID=UPI0020CC6F87|nr:glutamate racemase [Synechococcus sp. RedBA-s]MCP9800615.1 glutamate racemase [Synechococcus sp. RedBA-s]
MEQRIGLLDSGLGGLTVLRRMLEHHPEIPFVYLGDTARVPYGHRSPNEIRRIAAEVVGWLRRQQVDAVLMACNTTNALAFDIAEAEAGSGLPVFGLIDCVASQLSCTRVGVLATPATASSGAYGRALRLVDPSCQVIEIGCPAFVPLIEAGDFSDPRLRAAAIAYLEPLLAERVEAIVLGCTHYPLLEDLLRELLPPEVLLVDPAQAAVAQLGQRLGKAPLHQARSCGLHPREVPVERGRFCVTGDAEAFALAAAPWLGWQPQVERVCLRSSVGAF